MKKHFLTKKSSKEILEYFDSEFKMYTQASKRAYNLMKRNEDNFDVHLKAQYLWLSLHGKMHAALKYKWLGIF